MPCAWSPLCYQERNSQLAISGPMSFGRNSELDKNEISAAVKSFILGKFLPTESPDSLDDSRALISHGVLDSLATVQLVSFLEDNFHINVQADEINIDNLDTISDIASFVATKLNQ